MNPVFTIEMENGQVMKGELYPDVAPNSVANFVELANKGDELLEQSGRNDKDKHTVEAGGSRRTQWREILDGFAARTDRSVCHNGERRKFDARCATAAFQERSESIRNVLNNAERQNTGKACRIMDYIL